MATLNGLGRIVAEAEGNFVKRAAISISTLLLVDVQVVKVQTMKTSYLMISRKRTTACVKGLRHPLTFHDNATMHPELEVVVYPLTIC
jgi:hypothetical protein